MDFRKKISKKLVLKLLLFVAVIGLAAVFDAYSDKSTEEGKEIRSESKDATNDQHSVYFIAQSNCVTAKTSVQKNFNRKPQLKSHDKFIRKHHQLRNHQVLKAEVQSQTTPLIDSYHYLAFQNYFFSDPDDYPVFS